MKTDFIPAYLQLAEQFVERGLFRRLIGIIGYCVQPGLEEAVVSVIIGV